ncbi:branched-chain amino acid ABC transporter permease [Ancylobacter lacus]|nr:branched-chain amino acid ABC transporter permease [Ancylobacter lacus]MBS7537415.1 branched-chain amino acid ABC transporter permease [Ancylobacter lacus]
MSFCSLHAGRLFARLLLPALLILLAGCSGVIDADQASICRAVAPALHEDGVDIREIALRPVPNEPHALRLAYTVRDDLGSRAHWLICQFAGAGGTARFDLVDVETDHGGVSDIKLLILKRWWLPEHTGRSLSGAAFGMGASAAYWVQQALNGLTLAGIYGLMATSFALLYGLTGRINLALGEIGVFGGTAMLIGMTVALASGTLSGPTLLLAFLAGIAAAALLGGVLGQAVLLPVMARARGTQPVLIAGVALAVVIGEALRITVPNRENWLPPLLNLPIPLAGRSGGFIATTTPAQLLATGLGFSGASVLLGLIGLTGFGRAWRAYAQDPGMAALLGVNVPRLLSATFLLSGGAAGLAGTMAVVAYGTVEPGAGLAVGLKALIAAVIGGIGSIPGAFLGAIVVATVETLWSATFNIVYRDVVIYSLLIAFLVLRPGGLLNRAAPSPREF